MFVKKPEEQAEKMREAMALSRIRSWGLVSLGNIHLPEARVCLLSHRFHPRGLEIPDRFLRSAGAACVFDASRAIALFPWTSRGSGMPCFGLAQSQARITRPQSLSEPREWSSPRS